MVDRDFSRGHICETEQVLRRGFARLDCGFLQFRIPREDIWRQRATLGGDGRRGKGNDRGGLDGNRGLRWRPRRNGQEVRCRARHARRRRIDQTLGCRLGETGGLKSRESGRQDREKQANAIFHNSAEDNTPPPAFDE